MVSSWTEQVVWEVFPDREADLTEQAALLRKLAEMAKCKVDDLESCIDQLLAEREAMTQQIAARSGQETEK